MSENVERLPAAGIPVGFLPRYRRVLYYTKIIYSIPRYRLRALLFFVRAILSPRLFERLLDVADDIAKHAPREVAAKIVQRASHFYLRRWLTAAQKVDIVAGHYQIFLRRLSRENLALLLSDRPIQLAELRGKKGKCYTLWLTRDSVKEGEFAFSLVEPDQGATLARLRGSFGPGDDGRTVFWIGGLLGAQKPVGRAEINAATHDLNGLRPKHAVLHAACALSAWAGAAAMLAPASKSHIAYRWWRRWFASRKIYADYDAFWSEFSAARNRAGDYVIPVPLARRSADEVPARRRREWMKRYARVDDLLEGCRASLDALER